MFPRHYSPQEVVDAINEAYANRKYTEGNTYVGKIKSGIEVKMYLDRNDKIISAFPKNE